MNKQITLGDILTDREILLAAKLLKAKEIAEQIIKPNIERINKKLGQENDPMYLGYLVEYAVSRRIQ